eukprot:gene6935-14080_t
MEKDKIENPPEAVVVYVGGFLVTEGFVPIPVHVFPENWKVIPVFPSGVTSLHDRVMNIFYELKGGRVHYGEKHSSFHRHNEEGDEYVGKYSNWNSKNPVHIVGHSFGGLTALVLQYYLSQKDKFLGHETSADWLTSVTTINAPLNGSLMVYSLGASRTQTPVVKLFSVGYFINLVANILEYFDLSYLHKLYNFQLVHWNLSHKHKNSFNKLLNSFLGVGTHSTTDNSAYDMTIHSQLQWSKYLLPYSFVLESLPKNILHIDTSQWSIDGNDGLLSEYAQSIPKLYSLPSNYEYINENFFNNNDNANDNSNNDKSVNNNINITCSSSYNEQSIEQGRWYICHKYVDHLGFAGWQETWIMVVTAITEFEKKKQILVLNKLSEIIINNDKDDCDGNGVNCDNNNNQKISYGNTVNNAVTDIIDTDFDRPDLQIPKWAYTDRPIINIELPKILFNVI